MKRFALIVILTLSSTSLMGCDRVKGFVQNLKDKRRAVQTPKAPIIKPKPPLEERKRNGPLVMYYSDGSIKAERTYKNDKLEGSYKEYFSNGVLKVEGIYRNDKMHGTFKRYHEDGSLKAEEDYQDNILTDRRQF